MWVSGFDLTSKNEEMCANPHDIWFKAGREGYVSQRQFVESSGKQLMI